MKNTNVFKKLYIPFFLAFGFLIMGTPVAGQDETKDLKIKIVKEKNGERTVVDTTISLSILEALEDNEELKKLLEEKGLDGLDIDIGSLKDFSIDIVDTDMGEKEHIMVVKKKQGKENIEEKVDVMIFGSDSTSDMKKMRVKVNDGRYEYLITDYDSDLTWVGNNRVDLEVIEDDDGGKIIVKKEDGSTKEFKLPEEKGTYILSENGEFKRLEKDVVWSDDGSDEQRILMTVDDEGGTTVIARGNQFIEMNTVGEDGRKVRIEKTITVQRIEDKDLETLEKAGADLDMKGKKPLELDRMKFHPNPSNGQFTLEFSTPETGTTLVEIYNINGKKVYEESIRNFNGTYKKNIDISGEQSGTYFLKIQQGDKLSTRKIVLD